MSGQKKFFTADIEVRFRDLDAMGHVNNSVYFTYFEHGRVLFSRQMFNMYEPTDFTFIMAHISCDFLKPIKLSDRVILQMRVTNIGTKSFSYGYKMVNRPDESVVYATGESVQVCYDYQAAKSILLPEDMRSKLAGYFNPNFS